MKKLILFVLPFIFCAAALAQNGPFGRQRSTITISMDGLNCTTQLGAGIFPALTWSFTATDNFSSTGGSGAEEGKVTNAVTMTKRADNCTAILFEAGIEGKTFQHVIITQQDARGRSIKVTLTDVLLSSYQLQGEQAESRPTEQISFVFEKVQVVFSL